MQKVLFALGSRQVELDIANAIKGDFKVVGSVTRKEQVIKAIVELKPHILIFREELEGKEDVKSLISELRSSYPFVRIIYLATNREVGDTFLSMLVTYGVYDIINGNKVKLDDIIALVYSANEYKDISYLQPKILFDESGDYTFQMPETVNIERKQVVISPRGDSGEDTDALRSQIESELLVKVRTQLKEEYDREYENAIREVGKAKEEEVRKRLSIKFKNKLTEESEKIHNKLKEEMEIKAQEMVNREKEKMNQTLRLRESQLREKMNAKIGLAMKENEELRNKYETEVYEKELRGKLENELREALEMEKAEIERGIQDRYEQKRQSELKTLKNKLSKEVEDKTRKIIEEKEAALRIEMSRYKESVDSEKAQEIEEFKRIIESKKEEEIDLFKRATEEENAKVLEEYKKKMSINENKLKQKLSVKMEEKVRSEVSKITEQLSRESKERERTLTEEMQSKLSKVIDENNKLKGKYETDAFEKEVRARMEKELQDKLRNERLKYENKLKSEIGRKEAELAKEEADLRSEIEKNAEKNIQRLKSSLEREKEEEIEGLKSKMRKENEALLRSEMAKYKETVEAQKIKEIEEFKKSAEEEKVKTMEFYQKKMGEQEVELKKQLSKKVDEKIKTEVDKITNRLTTEAKEKERAIIEEMNKKLDSLLEENNELKNKVGGSCSEEELRERLEAELEERLKRDRAASEEKLKRAIQTKEQELLREESELRKKIEKDSRESLLKVKQELERQRKEEIERLERKRREDIRRIQVEKDKELEQLAIQVKQRDEKLKNMETQTLVVGSQKVVAFIGGKNGVGVTTVAINVAAQLAKRKKRTLYIELNSKTPSVGYWYQFENQKAHGLEKALECVKTGNYMELESCVVKSSSLKGSEFGKYYRKFPDTLDFLVFSKQETLNRESQFITTGEDLKNLYFYLMQNLGYEYIVIDTRIENEDWIYNSLVFSNEVYNVISQDISSIAYLKHRIDQFRKENKSIDRKSKYIVNRFSNKAKLSKRELCEFVESQVLTVPCDDASVFDSIYNGVPTIFNSNNKGFKSSIDEIASMIENK